MLRKLVKLMAEKRPRGPFMNSDQCAALYMGYYLKSQNMNAHFQIRQKYRDAMFQMSNLKNRTKDTLSNLRNFYGCRPRNMPDSLRKQLEELVAFENLPMEKKVLVPTLPDLRLGYDHVKSPFSEHQVTRKVRRMMDGMKGIAAQEQLNSFRQFSKKKKAAEDAAARAAQDAKDAAELARKMATKAHTKYMSKSKQASSAGEIPPIPIREF